jgi:ATP-dependent Clp protease ATP-binding subunit ClpB
VLDDGRLTDGQGRTVNFTNAVFIMTSNFAGDLREAFKPEFLNRIDEIVTFRSLTQADLARVVDIQLHGLTARLAERRLTLDVTPAAKDWLAMRGYDPAYGARPLKRLIQREISDQLALGLLAGRYPDGSTVTVDAPSDVATGAPADRDAAWLERGRTLILK